MRLMLRSPNLPKLVAPSAMTFGQKRMNKEIWTGRDAIKSIPNIMRTAAGVRDAQKKLLSNTLRCQCMSTFYFYTYWAGTKLMPACLLVGNDWSAVIGDRVWAVTPQKLLESQKVIKGWPSIKGLLGWPENLGKLTSMDSINSLLAWFFVPENRKALILCDFEPMHGKECCTLDPNCY